MRDESKVEVEAVWGQPTRHLHFDHQTELSGQCL